jgi:eukaryotic-like serine/threonine-protein kinase
MSTALQTIPENGLVLGRYRPLRPLGTGGSGSVWLARDEKNGLEVALKIIGKEGKAASRAEREAHSAARLRHPHCLRAFGFGSDTRHVYIPYEYVPGHTIRHALRAGELDDEGAVEVAAQVLEALAHAHAHGIVHRDVKPSNVLLAEGDAISARLFDFGLAQLADAETLTASGDVPGTLAYIPPERLQGQGAGPPADVWAVGVLLWEALSGRHPFWQASPLEMGKQIQAGAASLGTVRADLPRPLVAAVDGALAVDPARRPTAAALARALRETRRERAKGAAKPMRIRLNPRVLSRASAPALAAVAAGSVAAALPFYPPRWPLLLAALAAGLAALRPRIGLAFALAVPVFPLGNVALGLALAYAVAAAAWLVLAWPRPRSGLLFVVGALLAPVGALGLLPLVLQRVEGWFRRAAYALAGVLVTALGGAHELQGVAAEESPLVIAGWLWASLSSQPELGLLGLVLAAAATVLPACLRLGELAIAALGAGMLAGTLLAAPNLSAIPFVAPAWITCAALLVQWRRRGGEASRIDSLDVVSRATVAFFLSRLKAVGGPRWPQAFDSRRLGHATRR